MLLSRFLLVLGLVWASFAQAQAPSLTLDTVQAAAGQSVGVPLRAQGLGSAIAVQVDIGYDPQVLTPQAPAPGTALNGHSVDWRIVGEGTLRLVVYTDACVAIGDGSLVVLPFDVAASAAGRSPLTFAAALATDGQGAALDSLTLIDGAVVIEPSAPPTPIPAISTFGMLLLALALVLVAHRARYGRFYLLAAVLVASGLPDQPLYAQDQGAVADIVDTILGRSDAGQDCNGDNVVDVRDLACLTCAAPPPDNQPPRITSTPVTAATSGVAYSYQVIAEDPDQGDSQTYSLPVAPAGMSIGEDSGLITWTPTTAGQVNVQVQVTDSGGLSATQDYQITVTEENAPQLLPVGDRTIPAGDAFTTRLFAIDPDPGDTLTFGLTTAPNGMGIDPSTGDLTWTPPAAGENTVTARVTDSTDRSDTQSFTVTVTEPFSPGSTNSPPTLAPIADQTLTAGDTLSLTAEGSDPDDGDTLTYSLAASPHGMTIDPSTGAISWTATPPGAYDVTVLVEDQGGFVAAQAFIVTVEAVNAAPTANDDVYIARKGETLTVPAPEGVLQNDTDPNDDPLSATRLTDPTKGTIDSFNADGSFSYTPGEPPGITIGVVQKCRSDLGTNVEAGTLAAADVDQDGAVELVGLVPRGLSTNVIIADPSDCSYEQFAIGDDLGQPEFATVPTLVNLDDDPELEVVSQYFRFNPAIPTFGNADQRLFATNLDGSALDAWVATNGDNGLSGANSFDAGQSSALLSGPLAVDLDRDGDAELVVGISNAPIGNGVAGVTSHAVVAYDGPTGAVIWEFTGDFTSRINRSETPNIVDLDLDGDPEIIWSHHVLDHEGNLVFNLPVDVQFGGVRFFLSTAIANFDNDPFPEILGIDRLNIRLYSHDGQVQWEIPWDSTRSAGFPWSDITIAELDRDPFPEFVVMLTPNADFGITLYAFDSDGQELWNHGPQSLDLVVAQFGQTLSSSPVAIDLDQDGIDELIQVRGTTTNGVDDAGLYIFDGETGAILDFHQGQTQNDNDETLTVADIDGDGSAEIVTNINTEFGFDPIEIWDHLPGNPFPPAPRIRSGTRFQTSWVNEDGSIPTSLPPFWLQPGQNGWNRLAPPLDPLNPESDSFTYRVSDGEFDSNTATVNIELRPNGNPPFFLSEPVTGTSRGVTYEYDPLTVDVDPGDVVTYALVNGPVGMTIDPQTGSLRWYSEVAGDYPVSIVATDTLGLSSAQIFTVSVGDPVIVPDVVGSTEGSAEATLIAANLRKGSVFVASSPTVPAGQVLRQSPQAGSAAEFGASVELTLSTGPTPLDRDDDGDGFSENEGDCNDADDSIFPGANDPEGDGIDQDCDGIDGNLVLSEILVLPELSTVLTSETVSLTAIGIFEDGTSQNLTGVVTWSNGPVFSSATPGSFVINATRNAVSGAATVDVSDRDPGDDTPPLAEITAPPTDSIVTEPLDILGIATDANLLKYELAYAVVGSNDFTVFASSTTPVNDSVLGHFDPTLLINDIYTLRLTVSDTGGNQSIAETTIQVEGQQKVGNFSLRFMDLQIPMSGIPITVVRQYDTRVKARGDFGVGWRIETQVATLRANRVLGTGWQVSRSGLSFALGATEPHYVTVTLPGGQVEQFDLVVTPNVSPIVPFPPSALKASFKPRAGTRGQLVSLDNNSLSILDPQPGEAQLRDDLTNQIYNPRRFRYTAINGLEFVIDRQNGVESIRDQNGNQLTFSDDGISHSAGKNVDFVRDALGRIVSIVDPKGQAQAYQYDGNGDLTRHTDPEGNATTFKYNASHGLLEVRDPLDRRAIRNEYDDDGRLVATIDAAGNRVDFVRDIAGKEEIRVDQRGLVTRVIYDERGNILSSERTVTIEGSPVVALDLKEYDARGNEIVSVDPDGLRTEFTYNEFDQVVETVVDPGGLDIKTSSAYNGDGNPVSDTDEFGATTSFDYDAAGNLTVVTDPLGNTTTNFYDSSGRLIVVEDQVGTVTTKEFNASGAVVLETTIDVDGVMVAQTGYAYDANGNQIEETRYRRVNGVLTPFTTVFDYDANNRVIAVTDPEGNTRQTEYDAAGNVVATVDGNGNRTDYTYNVLGQLVSTTHADGSTETRSYDLSGNLTQIVDAAGRSTSFEYDELNRQITTIRPDGSIIRTVLSAGGRVVAEIDANDHRTEHSYDTAGRRIQTVFPEVLDGRTLLPVNPTILRGYDAAGRLISITDQNGNQTAYEYDELGRRLTTEFPDLSTTSQTFDAAGRVLTETDELGRTTSYDYDGVGRLLAVTQPSPDGVEPPPVTTYTYDMTGNRLSQTDALGRTTSYGYDGANRRISKTRPTGQTVSLAYDGAGNLTSLESFSGDITTFAYDERNRVVERSHADGSTSTFTYNPTGTRSTATDSSGTITYSYDAMDRVTQTTTASGVDIAYTYDGEGNQLSVTTGPRVVAYGYDALNRQVSVTDNTGLTIYLYDPIGNQVGIERPSGITTTHDFDERNRLSTVIHHDATDTVVESYSYTYFANGRRQSVTELDGSVETYTYDNHDRLVAEQRTGVNPRNVSYSYDAAGNRIEKDADGVVSSYVYDLNGQLVSVDSFTYGYDPNGNRTFFDGPSGLTTYSWDARDRLTTVTTPSSTTSYEYDVNGNRIDVSQAGDSRRFIVDEFNTTGYAQVVEERNDTGDLVAAYTYGTDLLTLNLLSTFDYLKDAHGNTRLLTDAGSAVTDTYDYDAFGKLTDSTGTTPNPYLYTGEQFDESTGLYYLRARYMDPETGSFLSRDPFEGTIDDPISLQPYPYAANDPVNMIDPSGRITLTELSFVQGVENTLKALGPLSKTCTALGSADSLVTLAGLTPLAIYSLTNLVSLGTENVVGRELQLFNFKRENQEPIEELLISIRLPTQGAITAVINTGVGKAVVSLAFDAATGSISGEAGGDIVLAEVTACEVVKLLEIILELRVIGTTDVVGKDFGKQKSGITIGLGVIGPGNTIKSNFTLVTFP